MQVDAGRTRELLDGLRADPRLAAQLRMAPVQTIRALSFLSLAEKTALVRLGRDVLSGWRDAGGCGCGGSCGGCAGKSEGGCGGACGGGYASERAKAPRAEVCAKCKGLRGDCICAELADTAWAWEAMGASVPMHVLDAWAEKASARAAKACCEACENGHGCDGHQLAKPTFSQDVTVHRAPAMSSTAPHLVSARGNAGLGAKGTSRAPNALAAHELRIWEGDRLLFAADAQPNAAAPAWTWGESEVRGAHGPTWIWPLQYDNGFPIRAELVGPAWPPDPTTLGYVEAQLFARDPEELARTLTTGPMPEPTSVLAELQTPSDARRFGTGVTLPTTRTLGFPGYDYIGTKWQPSPKPVEADPLLPVDFFGPDAWPEGRAARVPSGSLQAVRLVAGPAPGGCGVPISLSGSLGAGSVQGMLPLNSLCAIGLEFAVLESLVLVPTLRHEPTSGRTDSRGGVFLYLKFHVSQGAALGWCTVRARAEYQWVLDGGLLRLLPVRPAEVVGVQGGGDLGGLCEGSNLGRWLTALFPPLAFAPPVLEVATLLNDGLVTLVRRTLEQTLPDVVAEAADYVQWQPIWDPPPAGAAFVRGLSPRTVVEPWWNCDVGLPDPCENARNFVRDTLANALGANPSARDTLLSVLDARDGNGRPVNWRCRWSTGQDRTLCQFAVRAKSIVPQPDGFDFVLWEGPSDFGSAARIAEILTPGSLSNQCARMPALPAQRDVAMVPLSRLGGLGLGGDPTRMPIFPRKDSSGQAVSASPPRSAVPTVLGPVGCVNPAWCRDHLGYWLGSDVYDTLLERGWLVHGIDPQWGTPTIVPLPGSTFQGCCSGRWVDFAVCKGWLPFPPPY